MKFLISLISLSRCYGCRVPELTTLPARSEPPTMPVDNADEQHGLKAVAECELRFAVEREILQSDLRDVLALPSLRHV